MVSNIIQKGGKTPSMVQEGAPVEMPTQAPEAVAAYWLMGRGDVFLPRQLGVLFKGFASTLWSNNDEVRNRNR
jgi:hypothetical protein